MTLSSEVSSVTYPGNDVQTIWTYNFLIPADAGGNAEVFVVVTDINGIVTFISPVDFSINGVGTPFGGQVTYPIFGVPLATGESISILRGQPYNQLIPVSNQAFFPHTVEEIADLLTMQTQQLNEKQNRALSVPPGEALLYVPSKNLRKNKVLGFDNLGQPTMYSPGGGGGGSSDWNDLFNVPFLIDAIDNLNPIGGGNRVIQFNNAGVASLIATPSGTVNSVNGFVGTVVLNYTDVGAAATVHTHTYSQVTNFGDGVFASLASGVGITLGFAGGVTTITNTGGAGGSMQPALMSSFAAIDGGGVNTANNDTAITAAEADAQSAFYWPDGTYKTTINPLGGLTKGYQGRGKINFGTSFYPAKFSYALTLPAASGTGIANWFKGDQRFTDGGEYKIVGPNIRTYNVTGIYYDSTLIPHHAWYDNLSGSSGAQAYLKAGAAAGSATVSVAPGVPDAAWAGKQVNLCNSFGGAVVETKTVLSVNAGAKTVTFTTNLANTYTWNPAGGLAPNLSFAPRSWDGHTYVKVRAAGGGDTYGHIVRTTMEYVPKNTELTHAFLAATVGQYGGDVNFIAGSEGTYATSLEFAAYDQGNDVSYIASVYSYVRNNDRGGIGLANSQGGGRAWIGRRDQSSGTRYVDVAHSVAGNWRVGLDTALAFLGDSTLLQDPATAGANFIATYSKNGAKVGYPIAITDGVHSYSGTITAFIGTTIFVSPNLNFSYAANSWVEFQYGGAIINAALRQKIVWNSTGVQQETFMARTGDPNSVFGPFYGNLQGDIETGTDNDVSGDHWYTRFNGNGHSGATARIRLYATDFRSSVKIQSGMTIEAGLEMVSNALTGVSGITGAFIAGAGSGNMLRFNNSLARWELLKANTVVATW